MPNASSSFILFNFTNTAFALYPSQAFWETMIGLGHVKSTAPFWRKPARPHSKAQDASCNLKCQMPVLSHGNIFTWVLDHLMFCFILSNLISKWLLKKCLWYLLALWFPTDPVWCGKPLLGLGFIPVQVGTFPAWSWSWGWCPFNRLWVESKVRCGCEAACSCVNTGDPWILSAGDALNNVAEPCPINWKISSAEMRVPSGRRYSLSRLWH